MRLSTLPPVPFRRPHPTMTTVTALGMVAVCDPGTWVYSPRCVSADAHATLPRIPASQPCLAWPRSASRVGLATCSWVWQGIAGMATCGWVWLVMASHSSPLSRHFPAAPTPLPRQPSATPSLISPPPSTPPICGHRTVKAPYPVRSAKLSTVSTS